MLREYGDPNNLIDLILENKETIKKYEFIDVEMQRLFYSQYEYILENGNIKQKQSMELLMNFFKNNESITKNDFDKNFQELVENLKALKDNQTDH